MAIEHDYFGLLESGPDGSIFWSETVDFGDQRDSASYRQTGNGVNVGAATYVLARHVVAERSELAGRLPTLVAAAEQVLSGMAGDFVVATAGPDLESVLAGRGAVYRRTTADAS